MNYEKAYKEALEKARQFSEHPLQEDSSSIVEYIFPELQESEDELGWLTKYIEEEAYSLSMDIRDDEDSIKLKKLQRSLAWLEKQGKTITVDIDKMVDEFAHTEVKDYGTPSMIEVDAYRKGINDTLRLGLKLEKQGEKKPVWSKEDEAGLCDALWAIKQARTIAKDENDMGNLWYAENWLKSLKQRIGE